MTLRPISPLRRRLDGVRVRVPASKSIANRELVISALAAGRSRLELGPVDPGADVRAMREAVAALGYGVEWDGHRVSVEGAAGKAPAASATIHCGDGGTVARFGLALAALSQGDVTVDGSPRLRDDRSARSWRHCARSGPPSRATGSRSRSQRRSRAVR